MGGLMPLSASILTRLKSPEELNHSMAAHGHAIAVALSGLGESNLKRTGLHPRYGVLTIPQWTEFFLLHEAHHLFSLFMLLQELRTA
jgi:hypothetical protein